MVEHASSGRDDSDCERDYDNGGADACGVDDYARGLLVLLRGGRSWPAMLHHLGSRTRRGGPMSQAFYVWLAYSLMLLVMCGEVLVLVLRQRALRQRRLSEGSERT